MCNPHTNITLTDPTGDTSEFPDNLSPKNKFPFLLIKENNLYIKRLKETFSKFLTPFKVHFEQTHTQGDFFLVSAFEHLHYMWATRGDYLKVFFLLEDFKKNLYEGNTPTFKIDNKEALPKVGKLNSTSFLLLTLQI